MDENQKLKSIELEVYKQAHETRRKWESYIWQYGFLVTILSAIFVRWPENPGVVGLPERLVLSIVTLFVFTIFLNVLRARILMKSIEKSIHEFHLKNEIGIPTIPLELNNNLKGLNSISSTKIAVFVHFIATLIFLFLTITSWFPCIL